MYIYMHYMYLYFVFSPTLTTTLPFIFNIDFCFNTRCAIGGISDEWDDRGNSRKERGISREGPRPGLQYFCTLSLVLGSMLLFLANHGIRCGFNFRKGKRAGR